MNMKNLVLGGSVAALLAISVAGMPAAGANDPTITMHGFMSSTLFSQNEEFLFGNGQAAELPTTSNSQTFSGIDARQTRLWWIINGPALSNGWTTTARLEADFLGGYNGASSFSSAQETPRLRQAFFKLTSPDGRTSVSIGQQWDLMFPIYNVPKSLTHIGFPLGFGNGMIGWRNPGIVWSNRLNSSQSSSVWRLDLGAFTGQWSGPGSNTNFETAGNVGFRPQIEGRLYFSSGDITAYGAVHTSHQDLTGVSGTATPPPMTDSINTWGATVGWNWHPGNFSLLGAVYDGKGLGQIFGALTQFGDITSKGAFIQGGMKFSSNWWGYLTYSTDHPDKNDVIAWMTYGSSGRLKSNQEAISAIYTNGPYGLGFEYMHGSLDSTPDGITTVNTTGNQISVSAIYHF